MTYRQNSATSGTAIGAAVLAFLCGTRYLSEAGAFLLQLAMDDMVLENDTVPQTIVGTLWNALLAVAFILGGVLLLMRRTLGRTLIVAAAVPALVVALLFVGEIRSYVFVTVDGQDLFASDFFAFVLTAMSVATVVLAVVRPTSDWLEGKKASDQEPPPQDRLPGW